MALLIQCLILIKNCIEFRQKTFASKHYGNATLSSELIPDKSDLIHSNSNSSSY